MGEWPAIDSRDYIVALELRSPDDWPADFVLPPTLAGFETGLFLPRADPDWFGRSSYPPRVLLLKGSALSHHFSPEHRGAALPMGTGADLVGRIGTYASERVAPFQRMRIRLHRPLQYPRFPIGLSVHAPLPGGVAAQRGATRRFRGSFRRRPRYEIRQCLGAGTGLRRKCSEAGLPTADRGEVEKVVVSAPPAGSQAICWR